jgi:hypothetical protein
MITLTEQAGGLTVYGNIWKIANINRDHKSGHHYITTAKNIGINEAHFDCLLYCKLF